MQRGVANQRQSEKQGYKRSKVRITGSQMTVWSRMGCLLRSERKLLRQSKSAVQGHTPHLDLWMNTAVWSGTLNQVVLTHTVHLPCWSNPQTWGEDQGVWFGIDPWGCSERRNVKQRDTVWRRGFQVLPWGETAACKGIFSGLWQMQFLP